MSIGIRRRFVFDYKLGSLSEIEIEMGLLSHKVEKTEIAAGDHIYTWRAAFAYSHHGL